MEPLSVKRLSELLIEEGGHDLSFDFDKIWKLKVRPGVRNFLWMLAIDRIPTKDFLIRSGVPLQQMTKGCPWCDRELEWSYHLVEGFWRKNI